jgi:hypothetical protein
MKKTNTIAGVGLDAPWRAFPAALPIHKLGEIERSDEVSELIERRLGAAALRPPRVLGVTSRRSKRSRLTPVALCAAPSVTMVANAKMAPPASPGTSGQQRSMISAPMVPLSA